MNKKIRAYIMIKHMERKIEIKKLLLYYTVLVTFVLFGNTAVGFAQSAETIPSDTLPLTNGWIQKNWPAGNSFFNLSSSNNKVFARTWDSFNGGSTFLATDDSTNWTQISSADSSIDILSIIKLDSKILAGTWNGLFQSTDNGTTWDAFTATGIPADAAIWSIVMINNTLFAGTTGGVYKSTDEGNTWTSISSGIAASAQITSITAIGDNIFAGSTNNGVFKSTDNGTSWVTANSNLTDKHISQLVVLRYKLFAVTLKGVFISNDIGTSWLADSSNLKNVNCLLAANYNLIAGTDNNGAYISSDKGKTWTSFSSGMPANSRIWSMVVSNDSIYAGTSSGIWVTGSPIEVYDEIKTSEPLTFTLKQNYPNPFNSSTNISFNIPYKSFVSLKIYDRLGREVATLCSEEIPAGYYTRKWNAANVSSGIYFYRLQTGTFTETKKLILLR
jgi:hypothetical protein